MLIIEGPDCVGKTTLALKLQTILAKYGPWTYQHFTVLPPTWKHPESYYPYIHRFVVQDRFHISEPVYAAANKRTSQLVNEKFYAVCSRIESVGGFVVIINASHEVLTQEYARKAEMFPLNVVLKASDEYKDFSCDLEFELIDKYPAQDEEFINTVITTYIDKQQAIFGDM